MLFNELLIDKNTPIPMYYQLKTLILNYIKNGQLQSGDVLPTETEFSDIFGISRTTVRQAIGELVLEGYLYRVKSKGTFVIEPKINQGFMQRMESFTDQMQRQNKIPRTEVLKMVEEFPTKEIAEALKLNNNEKVVHMFRRRYANDEPILLVDNFLSGNCRDILKMDMATNSMYDFLRQKEETKIVRLVRQIEAISAGKQESHYLNIPNGFPIQLAKSVGYNKFNVPIEYSIVKYRGDKNTFVVELQVE